MGNWDFLVLGFGLRIETEDYVVFRSDTRSYDVFMCMTGFCVLFVKGNCGVCFIICEC